MNKSTTRKFLELIRFSHTVFALPFAGLACVWAWAVPHSVASGSTVASIGLRWLGVLVCMVTARSAAMTFNRLVDARFDAQNPRTANRHLPSGELTRSQAWLFFSANVVVFLGACCLFLPNWLPLAGAVPVLAWICGYSFAKRFTWTVHLWLGVALALSPVCAWLAIRGEQVLANPADVWPAIGLAAAIACWVAGFDIIYACQDAEFDHAEGLHSLPAKLGIAAALRFAATLHAVMLLVLLALPWLFPQLSLGGLYLTGLLGVGLLVVRQHVILRPQSSPAIDLGRVNEAFFQINAIISFCLSAVAAADSLIR